MWGRIGRCCAPAGLELPSSMGRGQGGLDIHVSMAMEIRGEGRSPFASDDGAARLHEQSVGGWHRSAAWTCSSDRGRRPHAAL